VAGGFNAPIAGVFFAVESVLNREPRGPETEARNSSGLTVGMVLLASVVAAIVSRAGLGDNPAFRVPPYQIQSILELPLVMLLGSTCGLVSVGFSYCSEVGTLFSWHPLRVSLFIQRFIRELPMCAACLSSVAGRAVECRGRRGEGGCCRLGAIMGLPWKAWAVRVSERGWRQRRIDWRDFNQES